MIIVESIRTRAGLRPSAFPLESFGGKGAKKSPTTVTTTSTVKPR